MIITNNGTNSYNFKLFWKPAIMNVEIKSNSNILPNISVSIVKKFLKLMYSKRYKDEKIQFLIDTFAENGHEKKTLEKISKNYLNELQNPPVTDKNNTEDIEKVVKLPWIPIIGPKLRQTFKQKVLKPFSHQDQI